MLHKFSKSISLFVLFSFLILGATHSFAIDNNDLIHTKNIVELKNPVDLEKEAISDQSKIKPVEPLRLQYHHVERELLFLKKAFNSIFGKEFLSLPDQYMKVD